MRSFVNIKFSRNGEITLSFTYEGKSCHSHEFYVANISFNVIRNSRENFQIYSNWLQCKKKSEDSIRYKGVNILTGLITDQTQNDRKTPYGARLG